MPTMTPHPVVATWDVVPTGTLPSAARFTLRRHLLPHSSSLSHCAWIWGPQASRVMASPNRIVLRNCKLLLSRAPPETWDAGWRANVDWPGRTSSQKKRIESDHDGFLVLAEDAAHGVRDFTHRAVV